MLLIFFFFSQGNAASRKRIRRSRPVQHGKFSTTFARFFDDQDTVQRNASGLTEIVWQKDGLSAFNESIISWNMLRPSVGYITVMVSMKYAGMWSSWHRLALWGARFQRTCVNKLNPYVHTKHCRVEMQRRVMATGFRIKILFHKGASIKSLKALFVCNSNLKHFSLQFGNNRSLPSATVRGVPRQSQMVLPHVRFRDLCSPTSISMIVAYLYKKLYGAYPFTSLSTYAVETARKVHDQGYLNIYGNWILNVAQAFDATRGNVFYRVERLNSFRDLHHHLVKGMPVAVSVRRLKGGATPYANGHILVVVGWHPETQSVLCIDPAFSRNQKTLKAYKLNNFLLAWGRSNNLAYVPMIKEVL